MAQEDPQHCPTKYWDMIGAGGSTVFNDKERRHSFEMERFTMFGETAGMGFHRQDELGLIPHPLLLPPSSFLQPLGYPDTISHYLRLNRRESRCPSFDIVECLAVGPICATKIEDSLEPFSFFKGEQQQQHYCSSRKH